MTDQKIVSIKSCARCGGDHEALEFKPFTQLVNAPSGTVYKWWALCPTNGEPILMRVLGDKQERSSTNGEELYNIYGHVVGFKNYQGKDMPAWPDLPEKIQEAWETVGSAKGNMGEALENIALLLSDESQYLYPQDALIAWLTAYVNSVVGLPVKQVNDLDNALAAIEEVKNW